MQMPLSCGEERIKVLILDDEPGFLELCEGFLSSEPDLDMEFVRSPVAALDLVSANEYHVVVSDHNVPGMDGIQFLRAMRSIHHRMPFILITGHGQEGLAIESVENGADFYMEKAGDPRSMFKQLLQAIRALGRSETTTSECLIDPFQVYTKGGVLLVSNGGERVVAAANR